MKMFAIYDEKALCYNVPFFAETEGIATRMFSDLCQDERSTVNKHPSDFKLYMLGEVELRTGEMTEVEHPVFLAVAKSFVDFPFKPADPDIPWSPSPLVVHEAEVTE